MLFTRGEHVSLIKNVFREGGCYIDLMQQSLADIFSNTPVPYRSAVRNLADKFRETGSVDNAKRCERPIKLSVEKLLDISEAESKKIIMKDNAATAVLELLIRTLDKRIKILPIQNNGGTQTESNCRVADGLTGLSKRILLMYWM